MVCKSCFTLRDFLLISQIPQLLDKNQISVFFFWDVFLGHVQTAR